MSNAKYTFIDMLCEAVMGTSWKHYNDIHFCKTTWIGMQVLWPKILSNDQEMEAAVLRSHESYLGRHYTEGGAEDAGAGVSGMAMKQWTVRAILEEYFIVRALLCC